jgi:hypothetical protein
VDETSVRISQGNFKAHKNHLGTEVVFVGDGIIISLRAYPNNPSIHPSPISAANEKFRSQRATSTP